MYVIYLWGVQQMGVSYDKKLFILRKDRFALILFIIN
jgi:hypothetical protein